MNNKTSSLSHKILFSILLISAIIMTVIFAVFEKTNRKAFYDIEMEKAQLIADTIEPILALNMYLGLDEKTSQVARQLIDNPNIVGVKISQEGKLLHDVASLKYHAKPADAFLVRKEILQPNSPKKLGMLELLYSNAHYNELMEKYTTMTLFLLMVLGVVFSLYAIYVKRLFLPLKNIAGLLGHYAPERKILFPHTEENNEIGLIASALQEMQKKILEYAQNQKDINRTLEKKVDEKTRELRTQLYTDALTDLPNRLQIVEDLTQAGEGVLLIINIDDFTEINDFFGHIAGDAVLVDLSRRLKNLIHIDNHVTLYRLSGDEFALLIEKVMTYSELGRFVDALVRNIERMVFFHDNNEIGIRVTVGATLQLSSALEKADIALKAARKSRISHLVYSEEMKIEKQYQENMEWVKRLKHAIEYNAILPVFQPIFGRDGDVVSYECLMRMRDEKGELVSPYRFLEIAKKSRLYAELTRIMVKKSCSFFANRKEGFSVNLSVEDILNDEMVGYIKRMVKHYGVSGQIIFEILESEGIENYREVARFIGEMKALGCQIAIDDFGSGYSNFEHLMQLDIDYIKIDGTLIKSIDTDINAKIVVETIVDFAQRLHIKTVAEFVHSKDVYERVKLLGIDRFQGFHLGEPSTDLIG